MQSPTEVSPSHPPCSSCPREPLPALAALIVALASTVVLTLAGCASPGGIAPSAKTLAPASLGLQDGSPTTAIAATWWQAFGDSALNTLVERSLQDHPSLQLAQARLARAEAGVDGTRAADGVQVNGSFDATRQRFTAHGLVPPPLAGAMQTSATLQAGASWELDFFGRNRAALEAALGAQRAAAAEVQAAHVLLASNVARTYVQLARLVDQREVQQRSLAQRDETLALIRQRVQAGLDTTVELRQGQAALPETRQQLEALDEQIALTRHSLAALTLQPPNALDDLSPRLQPVQALPVPATLPADLLSRRADISAARWRVEAATQDMAAARAQFYPNVNLTAFVGLSSLGLDRLLRSGSEQYGVGPAVHLPIFDAGRLRANLRGKAADLDAAVDSYNTSLIDAVHDAANQISSLQSIARQQREQSTAQADAEAAYDVSLQRFKAGLGTYLTVLNAEATVLNQRRLAVDLKARALDGQVALIRALGGGYSADASGAAVAAATLATPAPTAR